MGDEPPGLLDELKRRKVVRTGIVYVAAAFALLEFADIAFPRLGLPDAAVNAVLWLGLAGLPVALGLAWRFDVHGGSAHAGPVRWITPTTILAALALVAVGVGTGRLWGGLDEPAAPTPQRAFAARGPSVAVLAFRDLGGGDEAYFGAGLAEDIATELSRFSGLRVVPPRAAGESGAQLANAALAVDYLLQGSVRRDADAVRVAAQLLDAGSSSQIWAESFDRDLTAADLFAVQDDIARRVVASVADPTGALARAGQRASRDVPTESLEAYDCVLQAYEYTEVHDAATHLRARGCLERAVEIDPRYADAWAWLAYLYREEYHHARNTGPDPLGRAEAALERALLLDASNPMAHFTSAMVLFSRRDLEGGLAASRRAVELNPNDATILGALAFYVSYSGEWEEGMGLARRAAELNPAHPTWLYTVLSGNQYRRGDYAGALESLAKLGSRRDTQALIHRTAALAQLGRLDEARAAARELLLTEEGFSEDPRGYLERIYLNETVIELFAEGLRKAGVEVPAPSG